MVKVTLDNCDQHYNTKAFLEENKNCFLLAPERHQDTEYKIGRTYLSRFNNWGAYKLLNVENAGQHDFAVTLQWLKSGIVSVICAYNSYCDCEVVFQG